MKPRVFTIDRDLGDDRDVFKVGDVIVTAKAHYVVSFVRPVDSRTWPNRWRVEAHRVDRDGAVTAASNGGVCHPTGTYRSGETAAEFFDRTPTEVAAAFTGATEGSGSGD